MIEATCSACGTLNRVSEANVHVGAKFITCANCKSRIVIPAVPAPPAKHSPEALTAAEPSNVVDLTDLPAPKRPSQRPLPIPHQPRPVPSRPEQRGGLAAALDSELPVPKSLRSPGRSSTRVLDVDDRPGGADSGIDLPAPKRPWQRPLGPDLVHDIVDLPAPKSERSLADLPASKRSPGRTLANLPAGDPIPTARPDLPAPGTTKPPVGSDLPLSGGPILADLPAPRVQGTSSKLSDADLLAPKGASDDLSPVMIHPTGEDPDVSTPVSSFDTPPQPSSRHPDLPTPEVLFDDLPELPYTGTSEVPAPRSPFDDLPGLSHAGRRRVSAPRNHAESPPGRPIEPIEQADQRAPSRSIHDLEQPVRAGQPARGEVAKADPRLDMDPDLDPALPAAGLLDEFDLSTPGQSGRFDPVSRTAPARPFVPVAQATFAGPLDLEEAPTRATVKPVAPQPPTARMVKEDTAGEHPPSARQASHAAAGAEHPPSARQASHAATSAEHPPSARQASHAATSAEHPPSARQASHAATSAEHPPSARQASHAATGGHPPSARRASHTAARVHPPSARRVSNTVAIPRPYSRRQRLLLGGLIAVLLLGGGGFVMYQHHLGAVMRAAEIDEQRKIAHDAYAATDALHWQRAAAAARRVVDLDDSDPEALGIGAEALLASALDDGLDAASKITQAQAMLEAARRRKISRPEIARAHALAALVAHQPDAAIAQLQALASAAEAANVPSDPVLALYLGWALMARGDAGAAQKAYDRAASAQAVMLPALYGRGSARLALGDLEGARADFAAVLELARDHLGAQVGRAAAQPSSAALRREADLLAILARKHITGADPRVVAQAWTLAGDAAMRAGRYDVARERFRKALAVRPQDLAATTGLAETELRDGRVPAAAALTARVLGIARDFVPAQLVQSEIEIKQHKLSLATQRLTALASRAIPLTRLEQARLQLLTGKLRDAETKDDEAADAYVAAARTAGELDLEPMLAAVSKLAAMTAAAHAERDWRRAGALRGQADELLGGFADQAQRDPQLALTLGIGYLQAGDAVKAEYWLRRVTAVLQDNAEAWFQLGRASLRSEKREAALEALSQAFTLDPTSADIGAELAQTYEMLSRNSDADMLYTKLLAGPEPSLELRARAGRYFARTGVRDKADEQARKILAIDPRHPAGLFLEGERLLASGKPREARQRFQSAVESDRDPLYLDALGRAAEALAPRDRSAYDLALRSYQEAARAAPEMLNPLVGQGRLYLARHEAARAVLPLLKATPLDPKNAEIMLLIGAAYQELQQPATALQYLKEATRIAPIAEAYWRIGRIERDADRDRRAMVALTRATVLATEAEQRDGKRVAWLTDALYLKGRVSFDLHKEGAACRAWNEYIQRNPPDSAQLTQVKQLLTTSLRCSTGPR